MSLVGRGKKRRKQKNTPLLLSPLSRLNAHSFLTGSFIAVYLFINLPACAMGLVSLSNTGLQPGLCPVSGHSLQLDLSFQAMTLRSSEHFLLCMQSFVLNVLT